MNDYHLWSRWNRPESADGREARGRTRSRVRPAPGPTPGGGRSEASGFSLIELLVVIAILALIASFAGPEILKRFGGAQRKSALVQIDNLSSGLDLYKLEIGVYPERLEDLVRQPSGLERWDGPYLNKRSLPKDPWGNEFVYRFPGRHGPYDLLSLGSDGVEGGDDENADIVNWE